MKRFVLGTIAKNVYLNKSFYNFVCKKSDIYMGKIVGEFYEDDKVFCNDAFIESFIQAGCNPTSEDVELFYDFYNIDGNKYYYVPQKEI